MNTNSYMNRRITYNNNNNNNDNDLLEKDTNVNIPDCIRLYVVIINNILDTLLLL